MFKIFDALNIMANNLKIYNKQLLKNQEDFVNHIADNPLDVIPNWGQSTFPTFSTEILLNTNSNFLVDNNGQSVDKITTHVIDTNLSYSNLPSKSKLLI